MLHRMTIEEAKPGNLPRVAADFGRGLVLSPQAERESLRGAWTTEFGALNQLVAVWECADGAERAFDGIANEEATAPGTWTRSADLNNVISLVLKPQIPLREMMDINRVYDFRVYDLKPAHVDDYFNLLLSVIELRQSYSRAFCVWRPASGRLNRVVHMWGYESMEHRQEVRNRLSSDRAWAGFTSKVFDYLTQQRSSILQPLPDSSQD